MFLDKIVDPRDALDKARRPELARYAVDNDVEEIDPTMPAMLMRKLLRARGLTTPQIPVRHLGATNNPGTGGPINVPVQAADTKITEVPADDDMMQQWLADRKAPTIVATEEEAERSIEPPKLLGDMSLNELRELCKDRGIKMVRRDNMVTLKAKLNGENSP